MVIVPGMTIETRLAASASTSAPEVHMFFIDYTPDPNRTAVPLLQRSALSHTTDVVVLDAPVNNQARELKTGIWHNKDTITHTFIVTTDDGTTARTVIRATISTGATLIYERHAGWAKFAV